VVGGVLRRKANQIAPEDIITNKIKNGIVHRMKQRLNMSCNHRGTSRWIFRRTASEIVNSKRDVLNQANREKSKGMGEKVCSTSPHEIGGRSRRPCGRPRTACRGPARSRGKCGEKRLKYEQVPVFCDTNQSVQVHREGEKGLRGRNWTV